MTFMNFSAVLKAETKVERVVFTGVKTSDWFFGKPARQTSAPTPLRLDRSAAMQ
jgi:hypothetical protein